ALPIDLIWRKRVIRCKIVRENWMIENGLRNVMEVIKRQKWEKLFKRRDLSASILGIPSDNGIREYIKEVWEESRYTKPLEITRKISNAETIMNARRVKSVEMKPFRRFIHFLEIGESPRVIMRHMSYVISVKDHVLPYGDWLTMVFEEFGVPLVEKKGEEPKSMTTLRKPFSQCASRQGKMEFGGLVLDGIEEEILEIEAQVEEGHEEEEAQNDFDWEAVIDEAALQGESGPKRSFMMLEDEIQESTASGIRSSKRWSHKIQTRREGDESERSRPLRSI
ncbi:hypothetical protein Dimus_007844, partial [Dionaea muscipula]